MRVGIVGAGITGLALHHYLAREGVESVVLEAESEPGGVMRSVRERGRVLDLGPQRTRRSPVVADLIDDLGLGGEVIEADDGPLYVYHAGGLRRVPRTIRGAIATDLLSVRGKLRALLEPLSAPPIGGETVEGYFARAFGHEVATRVAGPLYAGLYGSDPDEMPVEHSLAEAFDRLGVGDSLLLSALSSRLRGRSPPPIVSFADGMGTLPRALYAAHARDVSLDTPVVGIDEAPRGYTLETPGGTVTTDEVVLTVPAGAAASLLRGVDPASAEGLAELAYNPLAVVHLLADADPEGAGYQIPPDRPYATRGVTWNAGLFGDGGRSAGRDGLYTCFLGGATAPEAVEWPGARLGRTAAGEFEAVTGYPAEPIHVHRVEPGMPAYDRTWAALERVDPPEGVHIAANYAARTGIPGRLRQARELAAELAARDGAGGGDAARPSASGRGNTPDGQRETSAR